MHPIRTSLTRAFLFLLLLAPSAVAEETVSSVMDGIVTRLYQTKSEAELLGLDDAAIHPFITPEERRVLATKYITFKVEVPVTVSVMRHKDQPVVPFWLTENGFTKTSLLVTNTQDWVYEVWQKDFEPGLVELGINGFDKHRQHYFTCVGPRNAGDSVEIQDLSPSDFSIGWMYEGAFVYHDWDSLLLKEVPDELLRHRLLTTIRGRAREAHLVGGFRKTPHPSSKTPDQVLLTWSDDPKTTQTVQWRTNPEVESGQVRFWKKGDKDSVQTVTATSVTIEDRVLMNDRYCRRHTATLRGLVPGAWYNYQVGNDQHDKWSEISEFRMAPAEPEPFTFVLFGDTHKKEAWGEMLEKVHARHPEAAFYAIAGDLVDTGQYRDDWDQFFHLGRTVFDDRPLLATIGNHDAIDGLGAGMYLSMFEFPKDGPSHLEPERVYSLEYGNLQFLVPDSSLLAIDQAEWLEEKMGKTKATWKVAMFHFPPYNYSEPYPEIRSLWGYLFDKYHLDFAFEGHIHYYMRSHPMFRDRPVANPADGTIHLLTIAIPTRNRDLPPAPYAAVQFTGEMLYQTFHIDGKRLEYKAYNSDGVVRDELVIEK